MDNFMDKLARRFNSGEIMRANAAAEAREMKRAKEQAAEYERMMQEMRRLNLKNVEVTEQVQQLIQAGIEQFEEYGNEAETLKALEELQAVLEDKLSGRAIGEIVQATQTETVRQIKEFEDELADRIKTVQTETEESIRASRTELLENILTSRAETAENIKVFQAGVADSIQASGRETAEQIKTSQAGVTESIQASGRETAEQIKTSQAEVTESIQASGRETAEQIRTSQAEVTESIQASGRETAEQIKTSQTEIVDSIQTARTDTVDCIKSSQVETIEMVESLKCLQKDEAEAIRAIQKELADAIAGIQQETMGNQQFLAEKMNAVSKSLETLEEKLNPQNGEERQLLEEIKASVSSIQSVVIGMQDYVHRENVKVYRNVQAVILDVASQKTRDLGDRIDALEKKMGAVKGVAPLVIITMILALVSTVVQVLALFGVF